MPVGGIKKNISCQRANIKEIILCHENKSDIDEIKPEYIQGLTSLREGNE
jgi:ATP-dependent Lon protease